MAFTDYLTTTCDIYRASENRGQGGAIPGDVFEDTPQYAAIPCSQPVPLNPANGETMGRDGLILTHAVMMEGPGRNLAPGHQIRIGSRRFDVDSDIDAVGFGVIVRVLCREVIA